MRKEALLSSLLLLCSVAAHSRQSFLQLVQTRSSDGNLLHASHDLLIDTIRELREEITEKNSILSSLNCTACWSSPCLNGGSCVAESTTYHCDCPDSFTGANCETPVICNETSCGANADCYVQNHQTNCVCWKGFSGDAATGCTLATKTSCYDGDPHYSTFDGLKFDYMGTCPYIFSQPCTALVGYQSFSVKPQNYMAEHSTASYASSVQVEMYDQNVTILSTGVVFFNKITVAKPYYWPSKDDAKITITDNRIQNDEQVAVTFKGYQVCLIVPDVPEFRGAETLCGLAGNIDGNWQNDLRLRDGTILPPPAAADQKTDTATADRFGDDWLTPDFWHYNSEVACVDGTTATNQSATCNLYNAGALCQSIYDALIDLGPFSPCAPLGEEAIMRAYDHCMYSVCQDENTKCDAITQFVHQCQQALPGVDLHGWRSNVLTTCELICPAHSTYKDCTSSCPATCASQNAPDSCQELGVDGCECDYSFVRDNTQPGLVCIPLQECGCADAEGNSHPASTPWLTGDCSAVNECVNGTFTSKPQSCGSFAGCTVEEGGEKCVCNKGYEGDGYTCNDIDECVDPAVCSAAAGQGTCTNTPGSYYCTCSPYFEGANCEVYRPNRHCADLFVFHGANETGIYEVLPSPASEKKLVYCDMTTLGGGWTVLSEAANIKNFFARKKMVDYERGFGLEGKDAFDYSILAEDDALNVWLGLEPLFAITSSVRTALRVEIFRCAKDHQPPSSSAWEAAWTDCTYDDFSILSGKEGWNVNITQECHGSERDSSYGEGWARWDLTKPGPPFTAFDNDMTKCSATFQSTGWWFDMPRCGSANLNGVRLDCDDEVTNRESFIEWGGTPISKARMLIRPTNFPSYDQRATPVQE